MQPVELSTSFISTFSGLIHRNQSVIQVTHQKCGSIETNMKTCLSSRSLEGIKNAVLSQDLLGCPRKLVNC